MKDDIYISICELRQEVVVLAAYSILSSFFITYMNCYLYYLQNRIFDCNIDTEIS